jgi:broad specificity phosphatase PhoE
MNRSFAIALLAGALISTGIRAQPSTLILVRHAEKASQTEADPVLSDAGTQRAKDLAVALADAHVGTIFATQFARTQLTAAPLAAATSKRPVVIAATSAPDYAANMAAAIRGAPAGDVVLVVGHSNTLASIIAALGGPKLPNLCDSQYSMMLILEMSGTGPPRLIRTHYGNADPVDAACATMKAP